MRRGFEDRLEEVRTDGTRVVLGGPQFFTVREGRLLTGDSRAVRVDDDAPAPAGEGEEARSLFAEFERALGEASAAEALVDEETRRTLRQLGYVE